MKLEHCIQGSKLLVARRGVRIGIVPPLELVTCSHVFSPQLPLNQTCKLSSPNRQSKEIDHTGKEPSEREHNRGAGVFKRVMEQWVDQEARE